MAQPRWKRLKDDGKVVSYKLMSNVHPRDGEPDLWLHRRVDVRGVTCWTRPLNTGSPWSMEVVGSLETGARSWPMERGELRTIMGDTLARELMFK